METKHQEMREALHCNRDIFNQSAAGIDAEIKRLKEQRHNLFMDYKARKKAIITQYESPTPESWAKRQRKEAFSIQRSIGGMFNEWKSNVIDPESVSVRFEQKEDCLEFNFTVGLVPFKNENEA